MINKEILEKTAALSRLKLSDEERDNILDEMSKIIDHFTDLSELKMDGVEPLHTPVDMENVWRNDSVLNPQTEKELFENVQDKVEGQVKVPQVVK